MVGDSAVLPSLFTDTYPQSQVFIYQDPGYGYA